MLVSVAVAVSAVAIALALVLASRPVARRCRPAVRRCGELVHRWWTAVPPERLPQWFEYGLMVSMLMLVSGAAMAAGLTAVFVEILDGVVENDDLTVVDRPAVEWIAERRIGGAGALAVAVTDIGGKILLGLLLAVTAVTASVRVRTAQPVVLAVVAGGGGVLLVGGIKGLIGRDRPDPPYRAIVEDGYSFPSGHSASVLIVLGTVAWLISMLTGRRVVRATAWVTAGILTVAVGASRVYLGVHYPSDVLGGWVLGATWLVTVAVAARLPHPWLLAVPDRCPASAPTRVPAIVPTGGSATGGAGSATGGAGFRAGGGAGWSSWRRHPAVLFTATAVTGLVTIFGIVAIEAMTG